MTKRWSNLFEIAYLCGVENMIEQRIDGLLTAAAALSIVEVDESGQAVDTARPPVRVEHAQVLGLDVRHGEERGLGDPSTLTRHLEQMNRVEDGTQPAVLGAKVHDGLDDTEALVENALRVGEIVRAGQLRPSEVRLQEQIDFRVRTVQRVRVHFVPHVLTQLLV